MYVLFFLLLAAFGYGALYYRKSPIILLLGIISVVVLMLTPMNDEIVWSTTETETVTGAQFGETTNLTVAATDNHVLFKLTEGWEYTTWVWIHIALLIVHSVMFFAFFFRTEA